MTKMTLNRMAHCELDFNTPTGFGQPVTLASSFEGEELDLETMDLIISMVEEYRL